VRRAATATIDSRFIQIPLLNCYPFVENFAFSDWVYKSLMTSLLALALPRNSLAVISLNPPFCATQTALHSAQMKLSPSLRVRLSLIGWGWSVQAISVWQLGQFIGLVGDHLIELGPRERMSNAAQLYQALFIDRRLAPCEICANDEAPLDSASDNDIDIIASFQSP
jgi:hypothetical protein